jgi:hypothetical protein
MLRFKICRSLLYFELTKNAFQNELTSFFNSVEIVPPFNRDPAPLAIQLKVVAMMRQTLNG